VKRFALAALVVAAMPALGTAQTLPPQAAQARLRVFIDCGGDCYEEYLRDQIKFVDFVRQAQDADVHLLSSSTDTGGGGREMVLRFVGRGRYAGHDEELKVISLAADTVSMRRSQVLRTVHVGFLSFMARDGIPPAIDLSVEATESAAPSKAARDPWRAWVFSVSSSADYSAEESTRDRSWDFDFGADRITEQWKITFGTSFDYSKEAFDLDEDEPLVAVRRERQTDWFVAKSWGPNWSIGFDGALRSSTFGNTKFSLRTAPAIEFSVFPYSEYATRQLRFQYSMGVAHARYNELTIYDTLDDTHPVHSASATFEREEPWGSIQAGFEFSQYLHDLSFYRLEAAGEASIRITRGLSVNLEGNVSRIRDQLALPRREASDEEVLLKLRELQSGYRVGFDVSIRYTFGSLFNNIVNPRFGR
jgi:hypothetical protein